MPRIDHFGLMAPFYERVIHLRDPQEQIEKIGLPVDGRLLDAGGGTGRVAQALRGLASQVVVADLSLGMLRQAQQKRGLETVSAQSERLPFPGASFERVIMVDALHHVISQAETASELWRVLQPGGRIVIEEPDVRTWAVKLVALGEKLALMRSHFLSPPRVAALFTYPGADTRLLEDGFTTCIVIEKQKAMR